VEGELKGLGYFYLLAFEFTQKGENYEKIKKMDWIRYLFGFSVCSVGYFY
jgi:hypothetical protein